MYIFSQSFSDDVRDAIPFLYYTFNNIHKYHASLSGYRTFGKNVQWWIKIEKKRNVAYNVKFCGWRI